MCADEAVAERFGAMKLSALEDFYTFAAEQVAPLAFLIRREAQAPRLVSVIESTGDDGLARWRNEFADQRGVAEGVRHTGPASSGELVHFPSRDLNPRT